ncbi:hypothetical protein [Bacteroides pyogenes]|uniref:hypothetical protein n=1 Tax=Bacteroides pyogenes TaxID=310300 RepID=UPI001BA5FB77|nr:hypothetical protein [Bacteroides pyogenes]MBR8726474.1 hypothetical protein [Bacteroides pyogenes]MBR8739824.1 hypothetical protein [Bacteroides pyogenes]MBR8755638.1 hypothetical protein [Bacteroides pyogenes]MBR8796937.1 hypothetical protein [Bacteroides pyogenes]MBR8810537.1 hypothetical protein [Bacteroides pyogenes]
MRKQLFLAVTQRLKSRVPQLAHFDLWNQNVEFIEQEAVFAMPAVFMEFKPIHWETLNGGIQQADIVFCLHVVTQWVHPSLDGSPYQEDSLQIFDLLDDIAAALHGMQGSGYTGCVRTDSATNHNHEDIREDIETFRIRVTGKL